MNNGFINPHRLTASYNAFFQHPVMGLQKLAALEDGFWYLLPRKPKPVQADIPPLTGLAMTATFDNKEKCRLVVGLNGGDISGMVIDMSLDQEGYADSIKLMIQERPNRDYQVPATERFTNWQDMAKYLNINSRRNGRKRPNYDKLSIDLIRYFMVDGLGLPKKPVKPS